MTAKERESQLAPLREKTICDCINDRISDLGLEDTEHNCYGLVCCDDDEAWLRIDGDGSGAVYIDGLKTLEALAEVDYTGDFEVDQAAFYAALIRYESGE